MIKRKGLGEIRTIYQPHVQTNVSLCISYFYVFCNSFMDLYEQGFT